MNGFCLPDDEGLRRSLGTLLARQDGAGRTPAAIRRRPNVYQSSFPSEIVTCLGGHGRDRSFLLKYNAASTHEGHGYWGNVEYEARVYRDVLGKLPVPVPKCYGFLTVRPSGQHCMVLDFIEGGMRLTHSPVAALVRSAAWLGRFHAAGEKRLARSSPRFPTRYGSEYFVGWARRTLQFAHRYSRLPSWLPLLVKRFSQSVEVLLSPPETVIHGEFYPKNILVTKREIYPVDWQSAAVGRGEIDFASLTEGWTDERVVRRCEEAYLGARWPNGAPGDYRTALAIARVYWPFRWLGDKPEWTIVRKRSWWLSLLRREAERAGLI